ncbi:hypothetical protein TL16_g04727 [Triparma laevis f. inornata]|uniref:Uncharacterized protein n=1 Tax=Triparma laevis f. inornata TaxID=1714386 RepID=A0A9W7E9C7_9STRA|nr:hypothetical protein TL16_g04727 [Triparma laevis f. inornata]
MLTISPLPLPSTAVLSALPFPTYVLSCRSSDEETYLIDVLQLPSTNQLPCVGLLSRSGLTVVRSTSRSSSNTSIPLPQIPHHLQQLSTLSPLPQLRLMISGSSSHCGKTTFTLLLLESLRTRGLTTGYLKPTTQCESESIITKHCNRNSITTKNSSVIFYKGEQNTFTSNLVNHTNSSLRSSPGFTRSYISGQTLTSSEMLSSVSSDVNGPVFNHCDILLLDGVGYPSVGSITGVSNAKIASICNANVLIVTPTGVGHAVDSYDLNASYFKYNGVNVLGGIINLCERTGFYSVDACFEWCERSLRSNGETLFGALPKFQSMMDLRDSGKEEEWLDTELQGVMREVRRRDCENEARRGAKRRVSQSPPLTRSPLIAVREKGKHRGFIGIDEKSRTFQGLDTTKILYAQELYGSCE